MGFLGSVRTGCLLMLLVPAGQHSSPSIPTTFPPPERTRPGLPIDQPPTAMRGERRVPPKTARMKQEVEELARLAASIPPDVDKVTKGQLPRDLASRLKQIEKLSKQLRREVSP